MITDLPSAIATLRGDLPLCDTVLYLRMGHCVLRVQCNCVQVLDRLRAYFAHVVAEPGSADIEVVAIERGALDAGVNFIDWQHEPGKTGRKDAYVDIPGGRLLLKVRTGMVFLQSERDRVAAGPCLRYESQLINFINAQYMNWLQRRGWLICHAAALVHGDRGLAIAGLSGGGKSTLMLQLLEEDSVAYMTNDRLFIRRASNTTEAVGIPKLPRINPGTIVHNPTLHHMLEPRRREQLQRLPQPVLWSLEEKHDVNIEKIYGPGRMVSRAPLANFLILNWRHDSKQALRLQRVDLSKRPKLLGAIMKSPGPFHQYADGSFYVNGTAFDEHAYVAALQGVRIFEAGGRVDFSALARLCLDEVLVLDSTMIDNNE